MRSVPILLALSLFPALAACGGGSTGGSGPELAVQPAVLGVVTSRDGSTDDVGGVVAACPETGDTAVTDADGAFQIDVPAGRAFHVRFQDPNGGAGTTGGGGPEMQDPVADGADIDGDGISIDALGENESCDVEVDLANGGVVEARVHRHDQAAGAQDYESEGRLDGNGEEDGDAEVEVCQHDGTIGIEFEVAGLADLGTLTVKIVSADGTMEETLGTIAVTLEGDGHLELQWTLGDTLPFGATSLDELVGATVVVVDQAGETVFEGTLPALGGHHEGGDQHDGDGTPEGEDHPDGPTNGGDLPDEPA